MRAGVLKTKNLPLKLDMIHIFSISLYQQKQKIT
jgi:hypothetical protein